MKLCILLHFYQPHNQQDDILMRIVNECYLPLTRGLKLTKNAKIVVNISGCLTQLLAGKGYQEVIDNLKELAVQGKVEFTGSAKYHAFLPLLPQDEVLRQIELNKEINTKYFGDAYETAGFFSPEMAVDGDLLGLVEKAGFSWAAVPQLSHPSGRPEISKLYKKGNLKLMFRNKRVSSLLLSGVCRTAEDLVKEVTDIYHKDGADYAFAVMDAETFGHHRIGHEKVLFEVLESGLFETVTAKYLISDTSYEIEETDVRPCTWTNEEQDFWLDKERKLQTISKAFVLWKDDSNPIHKLQWELTNFCVSELKNFENKSSEKWIKARELLDRAISSDQYWWASAKPWWSLEMLEQGAYELKTVLSTLDAGPQSVTMGETLYRNILDLAFDWQRTGYIRHRHLENSATFMKPPLSKRTPDEWFNQLVLEFEDEMKRAAEKRDFEKAVKWRDALEKIKLGTDIFDVLHVVDELWSARNIPSLKPFLTFDWNEFSKFAKEHFINIKDEKEFDAWKKRANLVA